VVDTSRGYADLKALFPDNVTRQIHPQNMRDVIESIANPVPNGGLDRLPTENFLCQATPGQPLNLTVPDGLSNGIYLPLNAPSYFRDPLGMVNEDPITYYNVTIDPGKALVLHEPGVWAYSLLTYWDTNQTGVRTQSIGNYDESIEQPGQTKDSWLGDPTYGWFPIFTSEQIEASSMVNKGSYCSHQHGGMLKPQSTYEDSIWVFYVAQNSGAPRTLIGFTVYMTRIGRP
jgi:hypothetical protein